MWAAFKAMLLRDLRLALRRRGELINPILFFVIVVTLVPLAVSPDPRMLAGLAPGIVWVAALLATLLSLDALFRSDFDDGALDAVLLSPCPLPVLVLAKVLAHWLVTGLPLLVSAPLLGGLLAMPGEVMPTLILSLALGTPVLSLIGAIGSALTVAVRRGGALLALLVLPLYIPVLVFGSQCVASAAAGLPVTGQLYVLGALLVLSATLAPLAAAAALRVSTA